jgi:hypothetical protein
MTVEAQVTINGTLESVWAVMADIENSAQILTGVEKIEILERPPHGIRGLKWRETRMLFGKPATVEKVIIAGAESEFFSTESKEGGFVFSTTSLIREREDGILLRSTHQTIPQDFISTLKALPMIFFKGMIQKAILQDLNDIKAAVEQTWQGCFATETDPMLPTRPCSFCLSIKGGSVFADFDKDDAGVVSLIRISYDGFGCCEPRVPTTRMNSLDSRLLLDAIDRGQLESVQVEEVLRKYFRENKDVIWIDALAQHDLL